MLLQASLIPTSSSATEEMLKQTENFLWLILQSKVKLLLLPSNYHQTVLAAHVIPPLPTYTFLWALHCTPKPPQPCPHLLCERRAAITILALHLLPAGRNETPTFLPFHCITILLL